MTRREHAGIVLGLGGGMTLGWLLAFGDVHNWLNVAFGICFGFGLRSWLGSPR